jgi:hypothetical protein
VHPYRVPPDEPVQEPPRRLPTEERFLIVLMIVIGGLRVLLGILAGKPFDGEMTLGFGGLVLGLWWGMRGLWPLRRRRRRRSGKLHDDQDNDRARGTMRP